MTVSLATQNSATSLDALRDRIPDFARDIRLNLGSVLTAEGAPDLNDAQRWSVALASAYATGHRALITTLEAESGVSEQVLRAAKSAAIIMSMNNVYYRFVHLSGDADYRTLPARLRMNVISSPGVPKADFELMSLAVSAINGCGMCIEAHAHELAKAGVSKLGIQSAVRIAATVNAASQALALAEA